MGNVRTWTSARADIKKTVIANILDFFVAKVGIKHKKTVNIKKNRIFAKNLNNKPIKKPHS